MSNRIERANSQIIKALTSIIHNEMNDPRIDDFVMVSEVNVTPDFRACKVKICLLQKDFERADEVIRILQKSEGFIKNRLKEKVSMPAVPKLIFIFDKSTQNVIRVEELLKNLNIPQEEE